MATTMIKNIKLPNSSTSYPISATYDKNGKDITTTYLTKTEAASTYATIKTVTELSDKVSILPHFNIQVIPEGQYLPDSNISTTTVYLWKTNDKSQNMYTEYIYIKDYGWEKLGEQKIGIVESVSFTAI